MESPENERLMNCEKMMAELEALTTGGAAAENTPMMNIVTAQPSNNMFSGHPKRHQSL